MKKNQKETALSALMSAAMALPIVAIPLQAGAEETDAPWLPIGATAGSRVLYYKESGSRIKVIEPVLWVKSPVGESWELSASATVDVVSGASPIIVSNQAGPPAQILTGASIYDHRKAGDIAVKHKWDNASLSVSRTESTEKDYESKAVGVNATFDFNERNTTLAIGHGLANDRVKSTTDATLNARRDTREYMVGLTQLLDRRSLIQTNLVRTEGSGYLNDPYKLTVTFTPPIIFPVLSTDRRPGTRTQWAWLTRYKRSFTESGAVLSTEYRYYKDDWGIRAHTVAASWLQGFSAAWKYEIGLRYYSQAAADFYHAVIPTRPAPPLQSSDQRLAAFGALEPSVKLIYQITDGTAVDFGLSWYRQQAGWKFGSGGSPYFEPLSATMINVGLVHKF